MQNIILATEGEYTLSFIGTTKSCTSKKCDHHDCRNGWQGVYIVKAQTGLEYELLIDGSADVAEFRFYESLDYVKDIPKLEGLEIEDLKYLQYGRWKVTFYFDSEP